MNAINWSDGGCARRGNPRAKTEFVYPERLRGLAWIVQQENGARRRESRC